MRFLATLALGPFASVSVVVCIAALCSGAIAAPVLAADTASTTSLIPYGDYIAAGLQLVSDMIPVAVIALLALAGRHYPALVATLRAMHIDSLLETYARSEVTKLQGSVAGAVLPVHVNPLVDMMVDGVVKTALPAAVKWAGGRQGLETLALAKISAWVPADYGTVAEPAAPAPTPSSFLSAPQGS